MNKRNIKNPRKKNTFRQKGATLISVLILSVLLMSLLLGASRTIGQKIEFTADFFFGEKSYFAAESGAEKALLILKENPLKHGNISASFSGEVTTEIDLFIDNREDDFSFSLEPYGSRKLRLQKNTHENVYAPVNLDSVRITASSKAQSFGDLFFWSIQCTKKDSENRTTISIQENSTEVSNQEITNLIGNYDNAAGQTQILFPVSTFWDSELSNNEERKSCFLSLQNLISHPIKILIETDGMAPEKARITSKGISSGREKTIEFEYLQNNLSSFFNFGLLHTDRD